MFYQSAQTIFRQGQKLCSLDTKLAQVDTAKLARDTSSSAVRLPFPYRQSPEPEKFAPSTPPACLSPARELEPVDPERFGALGKLCGGGRP